MQHLLSSKLNFVNNLSYVANYEANIGFKSKNEPKCICTLFVDVRHLQMYVFIFSVFVLLIK